MNTRNQLRLLGCICLVASIASLDPVPGTAQDCADYGEYIHWTIMERAGASNGVAVGGDYAYLAQSGIGLKVVDVTNPEDPYEVGALNRSSITGWYLALNGSLIYIADHYYGVWVANISDPTAPELVDSIAVPGNASGLYLCEQHLYVAAKDSGLYILSVEDPEHPVEVGHIGLNGKARRVIVEDSIAYVADKEVGLKVIDVSNPAAPDTIGSADTGGLLSVAKAGDYVYAIGGFTFYVVDVSDPSSPLIIDSMPTLGEARDSAINGSVLYVANDEYGYNVTPYDISSPAAPVALRSICTGWAHPYGIACDGGYCYVGSNFGLVTIAVGNSQVLGTLAGVGSSLACVCPFGGHYAFGSSTQGECQVFDVSDPLSPTIVGGPMELPFDGYEAAAVTSIDIGGEGSGPTDIGVVGGYAGVRVLDLSDPTSPEMIDFVNCLASCPNGVYGYAADVEVDSNYAFVTFWYMTEEMTGGAFLDVIDLSTPDSAYIASRNGWYAGSVDLSGDYLYMATTGITVLDVSDPVSPQFVSTLSSPDNGQAIVVEGTYGYAGYELAEMGPDIFYLEILDVSNPESLKALGRVELPRPVVDVDVVPGGGHAYVSTLGGGFFLCNVLDPYTPHIIGAMYPPGSTNEAAILDDYILIAGAGAGLQVAPMDCCASARVVADRDGGISELRSRPGLITAYPNPFRASTELAFNVDHECRIRLSVYDVRGARVADLVDGTVDAGRYTVTLRGTELAPGIYFAELDMGGGKAVKKVVLVK